MSAESFDRVPKEFRTREVFRPQPTPQMGVLSAYTKMLSESARIEIFKDADLTIKVDRWLPGDEIPCEELERPVEWFPICYSCYVIHTPEQEINDDDYPEFEETDMLCCFCGFPVKDGTKTLINPHSVIFRYTQK